MWLLVTTLIALTTTANAPVPEPRQLLSAFVNASKCATCRHEHGKVVLEVAPGLGMNVESKRGDAIQVLLSPNRRYVAVVRGSHLDGRFAKTELEVLHDRDGLVVKRVDIDMPFVRDVAFLDDKRLVADVGGAHFAGVLILVDPATGAIKERFSVAAATAQPEWVKAYERLCSAPTH